MTEAVSVPHHFARHARGDGRRFHVRTYNGGLWQVYGIGLHHICECLTQQVAEMVANSLEFAANHSEQNTEPA